MLTVHHLNNSRSQRVLWLLEELQVPYEITKYERDPKTSLAPHAQASRRAEENDSWMGRLASYEARGFVKIRVAGARTVMRLTFNPD